MKHSTLWIATILASLLTPAFSSAAKRPHIVIMLADDLGYGDVGYHGSQIATPHIDRLAKRGVRLEQFYAQPVCSLYCTT